MAYTFQNKNGTIATITGSNGSLKCGLTKKWLLGTTTINANAGSISYKTSGNTATVSTLASHVGGQAIGSLLMLAMGMESGCSTVQTTLTALTAQGFYQKMGLAPAPSEVQKIQLLLSQNLINANDAKTLFERIPVWEASADTVASLALTSAANKGWAIV